jgi:hypothetical protein
MASQEPADALGTASATEATTTTKLETNSALTEIKDTGKSTAEWGALKKSIAETLKTVASLLSLTCFLLHALPPRPLVLLPSHISSFLACIHVAHHLYTVSLKHLHRC